MKFETQNLKIGFKESVLGGQHRMRILIKADRTKPLMEAVEAEPLKNRFVEYRKESNTWNKSSSKYS